MPWRASYINGTCRAVIGVMAGGASCCLNRLLDLGAYAFCPRGLGDDQDDIG